MSAPLTDREIGLLLLGALEAISTPHLLGRPAPSVLTLAREHFWPSTPVARAAPAAPPQDPRTTPPGLLAQPGVRLAARVEAHRALAVDVRFTSDNPDPAAYEDLGVLTVPHRVWVALGDVLEEAGARIRYANDDAGATS